MYHIYRNDKYKSVFFNKYNGDNEAWANHVLTTKNIKLKKAPVREFLILTKLDFSDSTSVVVNR